MTNPPSTRRSRSLPPDTVSGQQYQYINAAYQRGLNASQTIRLLREIGIPRRESVVRAVYAQVAGISEAGRALNRTPLSLQPSIGALQQVHNRLEQPFRFSAQIAIRDTEGNLVDTFYGYHSTNQLTSMRSIRTSLAEKILSNINNSPPKGIQAEFQFIGGEFDPTKEWML